jgi:hypothetical protein
MFGLNRSLVAATSPHAPHLLARGVNALLETHVVLEAVDAVEDVEKQDGVLVYAVGDALGGRIRPS